MEFSVEIDNVHLWQRIIEQAGTPNAITATGRRWGEGNYFGDYNGCHALFSQDKQQIPLPHQMTPKKRVKYYVGQTRAIQPSRTGAGVWYRKSKPNIHGTVECQPIEYAHETQTLSQPQTYWDFAEGNKPLLRGCGFRPARIRIKTLQKLDVRKMSDEQALRTGFPGPIQYLMWWAIQYDSLFQGWDMQSLATDSPANIYKRPDELYTCVYIGFEFVEAE